MKGSALLFTPASPPPSRGRKRLANSQISSPLAGGVRARPVLDTGGGGSKWALAGKHGDIALACLVLVLMVLILSSCGVKGDPFLAQKSTNIRVVDLKGVWQEGYIELKGGIPDSSGPDSMVTGSRIYYAIYPVAEPPCDGCPIEFQGFYTYGSEVAREGQFFCKIPGAVKGNIYYFEVQLAGAKGGLGPPSNRAKVAVE